MRIQWTRWDVVRCNGPPQWTTPHSTNPKVYYPLTKSTTGTTQWLHQQLIALLLTLDLRPISSTCSSRCLSHSSFVQVQSNLSLSSFHHPRPHFFTTSRPLQIVTVKSRQKDPDCLLLYL
uniref:Uncharacterized protein n=1 Tax=Cacopsylla melanoneura TaxID=428564 RepID=A0A8D9EGX1_9HEMI